MALEDLRSKFSYTDYSEYKKTGGQISYTDYSEYKKSVGQISYTYSVLSIRNPKTFSTTPGFGSRGRRLSETLGEPLFVKSF